jgi:hypothetical protein
MNRALTVLTISFALLSALPQALAADFVPFEGRNTWEEGNGGEKKVVDGIDFWLSGAPPRKFKLLGYINDKRHKTGLVGMVRMAGLESAVAKQAKDNGGDAVILIASEALTTGYVSNTNTTANATASTYGNNTYARGTSSGTTTTAAVQKQMSRYAVIKYAPEEMPPQ